METLTTRVTLREELCIESRPRPCGVTIFGGSGDLSGRKLLPSLYRLYKKELLAGEFYVAGCLSYGDGPTDDESYRAFVRAALAKASGGEEAGMDSFLARVFFVPGDYLDNATYALLTRRLGELDRAHGVEGQRLFYLAVPPPLFVEIVHRLREAALSCVLAGHPGCPRIVVEKPFGRDIESARELAEALREVLDENQIYRIDHYLGKETVQNILMLRFANAIFEPLWNNRHIDHVQITTAESVGVEHRAGYYDQAGCLRDMFQNHMIQMLSLVAMEPPTVFESERYRDEKVKLIRSLRPLPDDPGKLSERAVRGQYAAGTAGGESVPGYREEGGIRPDSTTETFAALKLLVDNWRWSGVPFYLRSGKRMARKISEIAITFKSVPHSIFPPVGPEAISPNVLVLNVQPEEGISLTLEAKRPGPKACMGTLTLHFDYRAVFGVEPPEAYERLLLDCMLGDQSLFLRTDGLMAAWEFFDPLLTTWCSGPGPAPLHFYPAGGWGPPEADDLLLRDGRRWRNP